MVPFFSDAEERSAALSATCFCGGESGRGEYIVVRKRPATHEGYECPAFSTETNRCNVYDDRPLDCRIYPFVLAYDLTGTRVVLALDMLCSYAFENQNAPVIHEIARCVANALDNELLSKVVEASGIIGELDDSQMEMAQLPNLTRRMCRTDLGLSRLTTSVMSDLKPYFEAIPRDLSAHSFASIYVWRDFFDLTWKVVDDRLLIVAEDGGAAFLFVPPLGRGPIKPAAQEVLHILKWFNGDGPATRIENVDQDSLHEFQALGWKIQNHTEEFIGDREAWASLAGNALKSQRAACNYFEKHTDSWTWRAFQPDDLLSIVELYRRWSAGRCEAHSSPFFNAMIKNSFLTHLRALREAETLGIVAHVAEIDGKLAAFTYGCELPGGDAFAILGEVADLDIKGLPAFVFRQFCRELKAYRRINIMGDSDLPNLREVKLQYHPEQVVGAYTIVPNS